jgi:hypothetical protein
MNTIVIWICRSIVEFLKPVISNTHELASIGSTVILVNAWTGVSPKLSNPFVKLRTAVEKVIRDRMRPVFFWII